MLEIECYEIVLLCLVALAYHAVSASSFLKSLPIFIRSRFSLTPLSIFLLPQVKPLLNIARADEEMREKAEEVMYFFLAERVEIKETLKYPS